MEGDTIRTAGSDTMIDLWLVDRVRPIRISMEAIAAFVGIDAANAMSDDDRCAFVRSKLSLIQKAARFAVAEDRAPNEVIELNGSALLADATVPERRRSERRSANRREAHVAASMANGDRRQVDRRKGDRRQGPRSGSGALN